MIYIVIFFITTGLITLSEYNYKRYKKNNGRFLAVIAVVLLSLFASLRDVSIGTDVQYYLVGHFDVAGAYSGRFLDYFNYMFITQESEPLYVVLQYIGKNIFNSIHFVMFVIAIITNVFIYLGLKLKSTEIKVSFGWFIYCLLFFNTSLNILRQSCAIAIVWYLIIAFSEKQITIKKYVMLLLIAFGFHRTALFVGIALTILMWGFQNNKILFTRIASIIVALFPLLFHFILPLLINFRFLPVKYMLYFSRLNSNQSSVFLDAFIYMLPTVLFTIIYFKKKKKEKRNLLFYLVSGITSICCALASNLLISRLSYYFVIFFCYSVPFSSRLINKKNYGRLKYSIVLSMWFGIMWYINIVVFNYGETYPYVFGKF